MWECSYARESLDLKLLVLRLIRKIWVVVLAALVGIGVVAGGYFISRTFPYQPEQYKASSSYYVEYVMNPDTKTPYTYINSETWGQWVGEDVFLDFVKENLAAGKGQEGLDQQQRQKLVSLDTQQLRKSLTAELQSDLCKPVSHVIMETPELADALNAAVQEAFFDFAGYMKEIDEIRLVSVYQAEYIARYPRMLHSCILGAVMGIFFAVLGMLLFFSIDDSIWVSGTFTYRYGVPVAAVLGKKKGLSKDGAESIRYLCREKGMVGITSIDLNEELGHVVSELKNVISEDRMVIVPCVMQYPKEVEKLRKADGVLLIVRAGIQNGKRIEQVLDFLKLQDCSVVGSVLWDVDDKLTKAYYLE